MRTRYLYIKLYFFIKKDYAASSSLFFLFLTNIVPPKRVTIVPRVINSLLPKPEPVCGNISLSSFELSGLVSGLNPG